MVYLRSASKETTDFTIPIAQPYGIRLPSPTSLMNPAEVPLYPIPLSSVAGCSGVVGYVCPVQRVLMEAWKY